MCVLLRLVRQFYCVVLVSAVLLLLDHTVVVDGTSSIHSRHHSTIVSGYGSRRYPLSCRATTKLPSGDSDSDCFDVPMYIQAHSNSTFPSNLVHIFLVAANTIASISAISTSESMSTRLIPMLHTFNISRIYQNDCAYIKQCGIADDWIPIIGIFGVYTLPSGFLMVWIIQSQPIYKAPAINHQLQNTTTNWFEVYRVSELHLTHIPFALSVPNNNTKLPKGLRLEEKRQLNLLRKALKDHDWYYTKSDCMIVPDFTRNLQSCVLLGSTSLPPTRTIQADDSSLNDTVLIPSNNKSVTTDLTYQENEKSSQPESHFFWNEALLQPFQEATALASNDTIALCQLLLEHVIPVTSAFCGVQTNISFDDKSATPSMSLRYDQILISRRSRFRAGTRFTRRGADESGAVANFAETEQILIIWKNQNSSNCFDVDHKKLLGVMSYVQTRGSIPLRWSSPTDVTTYRPRVRIGTNPIAQARAFRNHLIDYISRYTIMSKDRTSRHAHAPILMVNLIDKKSDQGRLGKAMEAVLKALLDVHENEADVSVPLLTKSLVEHLWFDFHAEVKSGRWHKLVGLLEQVQPYLISQSYFFAEPRLISRSTHYKNTTEESLFEIKKLQVGSIRTNCMDCLDRTNVVQSIFGRYMLFQQLSEYKAVSLPFPFKSAFRKEPMTLPWGNGEIAHRLLWADNADAISRLYAGTVALKGDYTRTGQRTRKGALDDGLNSVQRYYLNNFLDADRQEGIDLLVGNDKFSNVNEELGGDTLLDHNRKRHGMSLHDAARQIARDKSTQTSACNDDRDHERIKVKRSNKIKLSSRHLDLRWLPGDLQSQVRNLIAHSDNLTDYHKESVKDIDVRASSDVPWWVLPDAASSTADYNITDSELKKCEE